MTHEKELEQLKAITQMDCSGESCDGCKLNFAGKSDIADSVDEGCLHSLLLSILDGDI